jgi:hypothetical protein
MDVMLSSRLPRPLRRTCTEVGYSRCFRNVGIWLRVLEYRAKTWQNTLNLTYTTAWRSTVTWGISSNYNFSWTTGPFTVLCHSRRIFYSAWEICHDRSLLPQNTLESRGVYFGIKSVRKLGKINKSEKINFGLFVRVPGALESSVWLISRSENACLYEMRAAPEHFRQNRSNSNRQVAVWAHKQTISSLYSEGEIPCLNDAVVSWRWLPCNQ